MAYRFMKEFFAEQEREAKRLLSLWVSELEPEFVYSNVTGALRGITVKGWNKIGQQAIIVIHATNDPGPGMFDDLLLAPRIDRGMLTFPVVTEPKCPRRS